MALPVGPGRSGLRVGVSVSLTAATAAKDRQPRGREGSRAPLPVILGAAGRAPQRERKPAARVLQRPARPRALRHGGGGNSQRPLAARLPKVRTRFWWRGRSHLLQWAGAERGIYNGCVKGQGGGLQRYSVGWCCYSYRAGSRCHHALVDADIAVTLCPSSQRAGV